MIWEVHYRGIHYIHCTYRCTSMFRSYSFSWHWRTTSIRIWRVEQKKKTYEILKKLFYHQDRKQVMLCRKHASNRWDDVRKNSVGTSCRYYLKINRCTNVMFREMDVRLGQRRNDTTFTLDFIWVWLLWPMAWPQHGIKEICWTNQIAWDH
jgi:hypothetical protein